MRRRQEASPSPCPPCILAWASAAQIAVRQNPERSQCAGEPLTVRASSPSMAFPLRKTTSRGRVTPPDSASMSVAIGESLRMREGPHPRGPWGEGGPESPGSPKALEVQHPRRLVLCSSPVGTAGRECSVESGPSAQDLAALPGGSEVPLCVQGLKSCCGPTA